MSTRMTKTWFDGEKIVTQEIPEEKIYLQGEEHMKSRALQLADEVLAKEYAPRLEIAKELRRLHLENEQLKSRTWVGLTDEERKECIDWAISLDSTTYSKDLSKMIEHKLRSKNT